jgi:hypothetical protein
MEGAHDTTTVEDDSKSNPANDRPIDRSNNERESKYEAGNKEHLCDKKYRWRPGPWLRQEQRWS